MFLILKSKRGGLELSTLAEIILLLLAAGLIIYIFTYAAGRAQEKTSEKLCRGFNVLRYARVAGVPVGRIDKGPITINLVPRACKTIDKQDLPGADYKDNPNGLTEGAKAQLRDMVANCWWMWLEGKQPNIFDTSTVSLQNKCFICYAFSIDKSVKDEANENNINGISLQSFISSLDYPYQAIDKSDGCAPGGEGGYCANPCSGDTPRAISSQACAKKYKSGSAASNDLKCCIAEDRNDQCINNGGECSPNPVEGSRFYSKWTCSRGYCYVKEKEGNFITYLDYVQGTNGAKGGAGFLVYEDKIKKDNGLITGKKYAVTLISPGNTPGWDTAAWGGATVVIPLVAIASEVYKPLKIITSIIPVRWKLEGAVLGELAAIEMTKKSGTLAGYNFIYISEYDTIGNKCQLETGVDGK